jgi:hypothetical protein
MSDAPYVPPRARNIKGPARDWPDLANELDAKQELQKVGTIYECDNFVDLSAFTGSTTGFSVSGGKLIASGYDLKLMLNQVTMLDKRKITLRINYQGMTSFGLYVGFQSVNSAQSTVTIYGAIAPRDDKIFGLLFSQYTNTTTVGPDIDVTVGDIIRIEVEADGGIVKSTVTNETTGGVSAVVDNGDFVYGETHASNNTARVTIWNVQHATVEILSLKYESDLIYNPPRALVGDSISAGYFAGARANRLGELLDAQIMAGSGDRATEVLLRINEIITTVKPVKCYVMIGTNDSTSWQDEVLSIDSQLIAAGISPVWLTPPANGSSDIPTKRDFIATNFATRYVDLFAATKASGSNALNSAYNSGDNVHLNAAGNLACFEAIRAKEHMIVSPTPGDSFVSLAGNQTISGIKTFTDKINVPSLAVDGVVVVEMVNNAGIPRIKATIASSYNANAGNSIWLTNAADNYTRVGINRGDDGTIIIDQPGSFGWAANTGDVRTQLIGLGFDRASADVVEINNGTPGTLRDLSLRNVVATGTVTGSNLSGNNTGDQDLSGKQNTLVSGTNIKTINGSSVLGSGNIVISGGGSSNASDLTSGTLADARLSSNVPLKNAANTFTADQTVTGTGKFSSGVICGSPTTLDAGKLLQLEGDLGTLGGTGAKLRNTNASGYTELVFNNDNNRSDGCFVFGLGGSTANLVPNEAYFSNRIGGIQFWPNDVYRARFLANGRLLIGTNTDDGSSLVQIAGNLTASGTLSVGTYTVATLPSASANAGREAQVTDSSVTTFGSTVAGGGSSRVKVYSNGTNWTVQAT